MPGNTARCLHARRAIRQFAQTIEFIGALERGENEELPRPRDGDRRSTSAPRAGAIAVVNGARDSVRRAERQDQDENGEKYAAHWENTENSAASPVHN